MSTIDHVSNDNTSAQGSLTKDEAAASADGLTARAPDPLPGPDAADHFLRLAYLRVLAELRAFVIRDTDRINSDPNRVCTTVAGIFPKLKTLRPELVGTIKNFDAERFDRLPDYSHALYYCQTRHITTSQQGPVDPALVARATELRDELHVASYPLVGRRLIPAVAVAPVKKVNGHRGTISDLTVLTKAFIDYREAITGKTTVTNDDLLEAMALVEQLEAAVGKRDSSPAEISEARQERNQAFFLLVDVYERVRVGVNLVRHDFGDAHLYAPSILTRAPSSSRGGQSDEGDQGEGVTDAPVDTGDTGVHPAVNPATATTPANDVTATTFAPGTFKRTGQ